MKILDLLEYQYNSPMNSFALNNKATIIITMHPRNFLALTTDERYYDTDLSAISTKSKNKEFYQDLINKDQINVPAFLDVNEKTGHIDMHEGRSRAYAAWKHGDEHYQVAIILNPKTRNASIKDIPDVWTGQYDRSVKFNFANKVASGEVKVLNSNVQKQYQNDGSIHNESIIKEAQAVYASSLPEVYKDLPQLGKGMTSIVLDKGDGTVLMFTRDSIKAEWLTRDWGIRIGDTVEVLSDLAHKHMEVRNMDVYVIKLPKLFKLDAKNKKILKTEMDKWDSIWHKHLLKPYRMADATNEFIEKYPDSILIPIMEFIPNYGNNANYDVAIRNTMQDAQGEIVFVDPVVSNELLMYLRGYKR